MNVTDKNPAQTKTSYTAENNPPTIAENQSQSYKPVIGQSIINKELGMHRKSIFADESGVLIAQVIDATGEVIASYPSADAIKKYQPLNNTGK